MYGRISHYLEMRGSWSLYCSSMGFQLYDWIIILEYRPCVLAFHWDVLGVHYKVDIEKAYEPVDWDFVLYLLRRCFFGKNVDFGLYIVFLGRAFLFWWIELLLVCSEVPVASESKILCIVYFFSWWCKTRWYFICWWRFLFSFLRGLEILVWLISHDNT